MTVFSSENVTAQCSDTWGTHPCTNVTTGALGNGSEYMLTWDDLKEHVLPDPFEWILIVTYVLIFIVSATGNFLVCFAVSRNPGMRSITNYFIFNLSIGDLMVTIFCLPPTLIVDVTQSWFFGDVSCKVIPYLQRVSILVSAFTLSIVALERFYAICQPLKFKSTARRAKILIATVWIVSIILVLPQVPVYRTRINPALQIYDSPLIYQYLVQCADLNWVLYSAQHDQRVMQAFELSFVAVSYVLPMIAIATIYSLVAKKLWKESTTSFTVTGSQSGIASKTVSIYGSSNCQVAAINQIKQRKKVAKMLIIVALLFALCYLPMNALNLIRHMKLLDMRNQRTANIYSKGMLLAHWLAYFNSAINPVVYNFTSAQWRKGFHESFQRRKTRMQNSAANLQRRAPCASKAAVLHPSQRKVNSKLNGVAHNTKRSYKMAENIMYQNIAVQQCNDEAVKQTSSLAQHQTRPATETAEETKKVEQGATTTTQPPSAQQEQVHCAKSGKNLR